MIVLSAEGAFKPVDLEFSSKTVFGRDFISPSKHKGKFQKAPILDGNKVVLKNGNFLLMQGLNKDNLSKDKLSVEAVVSLKQTQKWGSIVGYFQDNGNYERGFLLGFNSNKFFFALSTGGALQYVYSKEAIQKEKVTHLTGSFDGKSLKLFVNGKLSSSKELKGKIVYPDDAFFSVGTYKDKDENYPMVGSLYKVSVSEKVFTEKSIQAKADSYASLIPQSFIYRQVPAIRFLGPTKAEVSWMTNVDMNCSLVMKGSNKKYSTKGKVHKVILDGLKHKESYSFKIHGLYGKSRFESQEIQIENNLNFSRLPFISQRKGEGAAQSLFKSKILKGMVALHGNGVDEIALDLVAKTDVIVALLSFDSEQAKTWREKLYKAGVYGSRVTVYHAAFLEDLPIALNTFNYVYTTSADKKQIEKLKSLVKPEGFLASNVEQSQSKGFKKAKLDSLNVLVKNSPVNSGEWKSQYGNGGNTTYTGEGLNGLSATDKLRLQWIGRPGGSFGIDRNPRMPAPLASKGRLFHQGMNRMAAIDSHNGTILWSLEIPDLRRVNIPRDASNWCTDGDNLYTAVKDQLLIIDCKNGVIKSSMKVPDSKNFDWGYIGEEKDRIYGSSIRKNSQYNDYWSGASWYDKVDNHSTAKVCSTSFFVFNKSTGKALWRYRKGLIINTTISHYDDKIYFVECRHPDMLALKQSRTADPKLWEKQYLVCLDAKSGDEIVSKPIDTPDGNVVFYLQVSKEGIFTTASNSKDKKYHITAFSHTGSKLWQSAHVWPDGRAHHSSHMQHPVIIEDKIYLEPFAYSTKTGKSLIKGIGRKEGCHIYVGFKQGLLFRGTNRQISIWSNETRKTTTWKRLRPSCWLSMLPANGLVLVPEGGGGCSCGGWMETSLGFTPWEAK